MATDPTRPSFTPAQRRVLTAVAGLVVAALAGAAFTLTYDVLRDLARLGGTGRRWAPLYPAIADTLTALTILSLVITRNARWWTRLPRWTLLILLLAGGAAISVQDSVRGLDDLPRDPVRAGVAVAPHVMLVIAVWLWLTMFKQIRVGRPAAEEAPPVEQRGHVKVLEPAPAAPEPLALEAGTEHPPAPFPDDDYDPLIPFAPEAPTAQDDTEDDEAFENEIFAEESGKADGEGRTGENAPEPAFQPTFTPGQSLSSEPGLPLSRERDLSSEPGPSRDPGASPSHEPGVSSSSSREPGVSSEQGPPPLDTLPEPRPSLDPAEPAAAPALLPTDVEVVRGRDLAGRDERPAAATTRPDIPMPGRRPAEEDEHDGPPADRAEDPDADAPDPSNASEDDWNPPPSSSFRSGPVPPAG